MNHKNQTVNKNWTKRPLFRDNQRLTPDRLNRVNDHHVARMRMALLGLAGTGVIYGFEIVTDENHKCKVKNGRIKIGCGLALDCYGRQLYWPGGWIDVDDLCGESPADEGKYTLWVHYAERLIGNDGRCGCNEDDAEWIEEGVAFSLSKGCSPVCEDCPDHCCECVDVCDYVCGRTGSDDVCIPVDECLKNICNDPPHLCAVGCGDWLYADESGVSLACVEICDLAKDSKDCDSKLGFCPCEPQVCKFRSYVYRNPVLYELIQGCHIDLARVKSLSFKDWLSSSEQSPLPWDDFENGVSTGLEVYFTKPIQTKTLNKSSLIFTVYVQEYESLFLDTLRIPIDKIIMLDEKNNCTTGVCIQFDKHWLERQVASVRQWPSRFNAGAIVEFSVRGAMLRDKCDCMLDARPLDIADDKPGQQMPGDDFIVSFCVGPKPRSEPKGDNDKSENNTSTQSN